MPLQKVEKIWMDGELVNWDDANVHILTHTLHYGSGVFEGIRAYATSQGPAIFRLADHIKRLFNSAKVYLIDIPYTEDELVDTRASSNEVAPSASKVWKAIVATPASTLFLLAFTYFGAVPFLSGLAQTRGGPLRGDGRDRGGDGGHGADDRHRAPDDAPGDGAVRLWSVRRHGVARLAA